MTRGIGRSLYRMLCPKLAFCQACGSGAGHERGWICEKCRQRLASSWVGAGPAPGDCGVEGAAFAYSYHGPAGGLVRNMKYRGVSELGDMMARDMVRALGSIEPVRADLVVPVPMHRRRVMHRGFNHADILAEKVAGIKGIETRRVLERTRNNRQQARLSGMERRLNMENAISVSGDVKGKCVLLVDDVCTTGATAAACEQALRRAGAEHVFLLCYTLAKE